jgi:hypothetical protein
MNKHGVRRFQVRGHAVEVRCDPANLIDRFERLLGAFPSAVDGAATVYEIRPRARTEPPGFVVARDGNLLRAARWPDGLVDVVLWEIFQDALRIEREAVAIHAGAVSYKDRAVVFPAPMDTGKTTLVGALVCAGFDYLSDEAALIGMDGTLFPFPKPLTFEPGSDDLLPELRALARSAPGLLRQHVAADELRAGSRGIACEIGWVVALSRRAGARTSLRSLTRGEGLAALAENSFNLDRLGTPALDALGAVVRGASTMQLEVGNLQDAVQRIVELVEQEEADPYATSQQKTNSM